MMKLHEYRNEKQFINYTYELLNRPRNSVGFSAGFLKDCIYKCISMNDYPVEDFLYRNRKVVIKDMSLFKGTDILSKAGRRLYTPKPDLAFAPFNLSPSTSKIMYKLCKCLENECERIGHLKNKLIESCRENADKYRQELEEFKELISIWGINSISLDPVDAICGFESITKNPRSFIAVEVSFSGSMKHTMGSIINASLLGYYGVLVVNNHMLRKALRLKYYLLSIPFIKNIKSMIGYNVLIVTDKQFLRAINL